MTQYISGELEVMAPLSMLKALIEYEPHFGGGQQHDAQECLSTLLSSATTGMATRLCAGRDTGMATGMATRRQQGWRQHGGLDHEGILLCALDEEA